MSEQDAQAGAAEALRRKLMWRLIAPLSLLSFVNAVDRTNVSFAAAQLSQDLQLGPADFGFGVSAFFVAYLIFQYPHAALLRRVGIRWWLLVAVSVWGLAGVLMSRVQTAEQFYAVRFLLGVGEAGFAPGVTWYIARWTPPEWRARAMAFALVSVPLSIVFGGPLCGWLLDMTNPAGLPPWRWMFLVTALPNFLLAVLAAWYFVDRPRDARWLATADRQLLEARLAAPPVAPAAVSLAVLARDGRVWRCAAAWLLVMTGSYALLYWLPQLVRQLQVVQSELLIASLSALPQAALAAGLLLNGWHSDRHGERLWHAGLGALLAGIALAVAVAMPGAVGVLALLTLAGFGLGAMQGVFWTIPAALGIGQGQVPVGVIAFVSMAGTAGGVVGPALLGVMRERTGSFHSGILLLAGLLVLACVVLVAGTRRRGAAG